MGRVKQKDVFEHMQNAEIQTSRACAKFHPGVCLECIHSIMSNDSEGPDQTARVRRLISAFAVRICPKTHLCMARPK